MNHQPISLNKNQRINLRTNVLDKKKIFFEGIHSQPIPLQIHQNPVVKNGSSVQMIESSTKILTTRDRHKHTQSGLSSNNYHTGSQRVLSFIDNISLADSLQNSPQKFDANPESLGPSLQRKLNQLAFKVDKLESKYDSHERQIKGIKDQIYTSLDIKKIIQQQLKISNKVNSHSMQSIQTLKRQIDLLRKQLGATSFKNQVTRKFADMQIQTKDIIAKQARNLQTQILKTSEKLLQIQKKQVQSTTSILQQSISRLQQSSVKKLSQIQKSMHSIQSLVNILGPIPSLRNKYPGKAQKLKYLQKFIVQNGFQQKQILVNEMTYKIDFQGYLLDQQNRYLLNFRGEQIKLEPQHMKLLIQNKMLRFY